MFTDSYLSFMLYTAFCHHNSQIALNNMCISHALKYRVVMCGVYSLQCYSVEQLLQSFGIDESSGVSRTDFHRLCPALVQQAADEACRSQVTKKPTNTSDDEGPSDAESNT